MQPSSDQKEILEISETFLKKFSFGKIASCKPFAVLDFHNEPSPATFSKMSRQRMNDY